MYESRYQHVWSVPESGFRIADMWRSGTWRSRPMPMDQKMRGPFRFLLPVNAREPQRIYKPLEEHSGLCMQFARLDGSEESTIDFAGRYGWLGVADPVVASEKGGTVQMGEAMSRWQTEVLDMREAADLLRDIQAGRPARLKRVIHWRSDRGREWVEFENDRGKEIIASPEIRPDVLAMLRRGELVRPAKACMQVAMNRKLAEHAAPAMLWDQSGGMGLYYRPKNLLGAMWLQFALAVSQGSEFRECDHCGAPFEVAPGAGRSDKRYCSTSCRVMASRARRKANAQT